MDNIFLDWQKSKTIEFGAKETGKGNPVNIKHLYK
jgi:hypothetical protein